MHSIKDRLSKANSLLAPYAVPHAEGLGRPKPEEEDAVRFAFQRDRGRIMHSTAFRRLKGKTQVFVGGGGDHYRTRLTHTLEVAGISRDIARTLSLNEDLSECIALAHDLGHPPFGHAGEEALNVWMKRSGSSFEHNLQSYRIVTLLEQHSSAALGLNLNTEVLDGLLKHYTPHDHPAADKALLLRHAPSLEAQVVNLADEIAYTAHDCDDGLRAELFSMEKLSTIELAAEALELSTPHGTSIRGALIEMLTHDLYRESASQLEQAGFKAINDVYEAKDTTIRFSESMRAKLAELRAFLFEHMYNHPEVLRHSEEGQQVILDLCTTYTKQPPEKVLALQEKNGSDLPEAIKDYVCGMTDGYAYLQIAQ